MKINRLFLYAAALVMTASCAKEAPETPKTPANGSDDEEIVMPPASDYAVSFTAYTETPPAAEPQAKATIGLNTNENPQTFWEDGDVISVYSSNQPTDSKVGFLFSTQLDVNSTSAVFGYDGEDFVGGNYIAIYPHKEAGRIVNFEAQAAPEQYEGNAYRIAMADIPGTQTLVADGFDRRAMMMIAYSENPAELHFKNAVALVRFMVADDNVVSGKIEATGNIAGRFRADILADNHVPLLMEYASGFTQTDIYFNISNPLEVNKEYYVAVRPTTLEAGFEIYLNGVSVKSFAIDEFERNTIYDLGTLAIPEDAEQVMQKILYFDFSDAAAMAGWPTSNVPTEYESSDQIHVKYELAEVDYEFILANPLNAGENFPYFNVNRLTVPTQRYVGLPIVEGYRLSEVSFTAPTQGTKCGISDDIVSGTNAPNYIDGGAAAKVTKFELPSTESGKQYWLKVVGAYAITNMTLTYTQVTE